MTTHLAVMVVAAAALAVAFAVLQRDDRASAWRFGAKVFGALVAGVALAWSRLSSAVSSWLVVPRSSATL